MERCPSARSVKALVIVLMAALALVLTGMADHTDAPRATQKSTPSSKIDSALASLLQMAQSGAVSAQGIQQQASQAGIPVQGNAVIVIVETSGAIGGVINAIAQIIGGQFVRAQSRNFIELQVPLSAAPLNALLQLANLAGIAYIRPPLAPQALAVSEGVSLTGAGGFHANGLRGQGATVAVIDLGFAGLATAQARGELPTRVTTFDLSGTGLESTTSHGTAVAEIIHDMAPDVQLVLMKIADEVDFENAVDRAIQLGVDVINHSVGWFNTNFYDGTGVIDEAAQRARSAGILWVNAAGNYARRHWQGFAGDGDGDGWIEFSSGRESLQFTAQAGQRIEIFLTWRDWPRTSQDYDLFVFVASAGGGVIASSVRLQNGMQPPTEHLVASAPFTGTYEIRVQAAGVGSPKELAIFNLNQDITPFVSQGSVVAPAECSCALAIGAVDYRHWTTGPLEPFSSQGPTTDGRIKPDLVGPSGVSVSTAQWTPFIGTSAAAPHVAGAAALLLSESPSRTAGQLESRLKSRAIPMGVSTQFGAGRVNLTTPTVSRPDLVIRNPDFSPRNPRVGDTITVTAQVVNQGNIDAGPFAVELQDGSGTQTQNLSGLSAGNSMPISFARPVHTASTTITLTADPFNQVSESNENNNTVQLNVTAQSQPVLAIDVRTDRSSYQVGESIRVEFTSNADGFVYLYDVDAQGRVNILFPRTESGNAFLRAGTYDLANVMGVSRLTVVEPLGTEHIHAVLVSGSINLQLDDRQNAAYPDPNTFRSVIVQRIQSSNPSLDWAWDVASFQVRSGLPSNHPPTARFTFSPVQPVVGEVVTFDGSSSSDPDGFITDWRWVFEGENRVEVRGQRVNVRFTTARTYRVTLTVTDNEGATNSLTQLVEARGQAANRPPTARFSVSPSTPQVNEIVTFDGRASSDPDGHITIYRWDLNGDGRVDTTGPIAQARYSRAGSYRVTLTVIDDGGLSDSTSQSVTVGQTPPPPPPPSAPEGFGFFISSAERTQLQIAVRGDPSWRKDRPFRISLYLMGGNFLGDPQAEAAGHASSSRARKDSSQEVSMRGTVRDGQVVYTMNIRYNIRSDAMPTPSYPQAVRFDLRMDADGDGQLEPWPTAPAFLVLAGERLKIENPAITDGVFMLVARQVFLFPFSTGNVLVCNRAMRECVPMSGS